MRIEVTVEQRKVNGTEMPKRFEIEIKKDDRSVNQIHVAGETTWIYLTEEEAAQLAEELPQKLKAAQSL